MEKPFLLIEAFIDIIKRLDSYDLTILMIFLASITGTSIIAIWQKPSKIEFYIASAPIIFLSIYSIVENIRIINTSSDEYLTIHPYAIQTGLQQAGEFFLIPAIHDQVILITIIPTLIILYKTIKYLATEYRLKELNIQPQPQTQVKTQPKIKKDEKIKEEIPTKEENKAEENKQVLEDPESKKYGKII